MKAGFEYLLGYKLTVVIYDYTVIFCNRYISPYSRTHDQMVQASRSGSVNIPEGYTQESLKGYIKLAGVARASLEELLKDYQAFARQNNLTFFPREKTIREIGEIREIWRIIKATPTLPDNPYFPDLPKNKEKVVNLLITLINQANYLLDKLIASLKNKFVKEGGFTENLFKKRLIERRKEFQRCSA